MVMRAGLLMEGGGEGQFLGRREGRGLQRGKTGVRRAVGLTLGGQSRIHRVRVFHGLGLFEEVRKKQWPGWCRVQRRW